MKVLIHDYAGHPFPFELSRTLARRGHTVRHVFCTSLHTGPTGSFDRRCDDPESFELKPLALSEPLDKFSFIKRWRQENEYGRMAAREVEDFKPDILLSGNTPLDAQRRLWDACKTTGTRKYFWVQDVIGLATDRILRKRLPVIGGLVGAYYKAMEKRLLQNSHGVVVISEDFVATLEDWGVNPDRVSVIENWAPIGDLPVTQKKNAWSTEKNLDDRFVFMYTGTMGMKHDPSLILELARHMKKFDDVRVVVASKGLGANWLASEIASGGPGNIELMDFHPFDQLPEALAAADVLIAVLESDADVYSVPSKVLAYLCAQRPVVVSVPDENLAARIVKAAGAGIVVDPGHVEAFVNAAESLYRDSALRAAMGEGGRTYAEKHFDIEAITDQFELVFNEPGKNGHSTDQAAVGRETMARP